MKVIVCGAGQVGSNIARYLATENNDVTVIDQSPELIQKISDTLDVQAMVGFASHPNVLEQAGAAEADMIIAVTLADEVNMVACQVAHSLFNVPTKIARVRNQSYLAPIWSDLFSREHMPIDVIISPEIEVARAVARRLQVPGAFDMIPLADGKVRVIGVICADNCPILHTPLRQLTGLFPDLNLEVVAIVRNDKPIIPGGDDQMLPGDEVYFVADTRHLTPRHGRLRPRGDGGPAHHHPRRRQYRPLPCAKSWKPSTRRSAPASSRSTAPAPSTSRSASTGPWCCTATASTRRSWKRPMSGRRKPSSR